jgi:hypothetical protein
MVFHTYVHQSTLMTCVYLFCYSTLNFSFCSPFLLSHIWWSASWTWHNLNVSLSIWAWRLLLILTALVITHSLLYHDPAASISHNSTNWIHSSLVLSNWPSIAQSNWRSDRCRHFSQCLSYQASGYGYNWTLIKLHMAHLSSSLPHVLAIACSPSKAMLQILSGCWNNINNPAQRAHWANTAASRVQRMVLITNKVSRQKL